MRRRGCTETRGWWRAIGAGSRACMNPRHGRGAWATSSSWKGRREASRTQRTQRTRRMTTPALWLAGPHRVRVGDARVGLDDLMGGRRAAILYTDPPWGPEKMRYFERLVERDTGRRPPPVPYDSLLRGLAAFA